MSFFSRGPSAPGPTQRVSPSPYSRLPDGSQTSLPPRTARPLPPRYDDPSGFEKRSFEQRRPPPSGGAAVFLVKSSPSDSLALTNCLIVHPADFKNGEHVLVKGEFPLTVRHDNTGLLPQGAIGASAVQRQWIGLSTIGDSVTVTALPAPPHPSAPPFLETLSLEVGFLQRNLEIAEQFSADDMAATFIRGYGNINLTVGQIIVFEYHGQNLKGIIKSVGVLELAAEQRRGGLPGGAGAPGGGRMDSGIVMEKTEVTFLKDPVSKIKIKSSAKKAAPNAILAPNFKFEDMGIGGLDQEFSAIFRRAFASRVFPPGLVEKLGIQHVKGILLHGPPGTGKTLLARQIGKMLNAREPKIVNGPEILNKYVGQSEENIRKLFADAEKEYKEKGDESGLHIIIFDELDAVFKQRGSTNSGTGVGDTVVNQLLSKMDGVDQLNNILIIGMTNRLDMIDEALLRPGRLEVHMEISLPDEHGRYQILNIHTAKMRNNGVMDGDVDLQELAKLTKNFSGAEIGGLVKSATSFAFNRHVKVGTMAGISDDVENLRVNAGDFSDALDEVHPAFGVSEEELAQVVQNGIIHYDNVVDELLRSGQLFVEQVRTSTRTPLVSLLLHGPPGTGKTALAATIAQASEFPFIKLITPDNMVGFSEAQKIQAISKVFADSSKSPMSVVVVDNIERLLDWTPVGPRFSNAVLQTLMVLMAKPPPKGRRLLVVATSSLRPMLTDVGLSSFDAELRVPPITELTALDHVLEAVELFRSQRDRARAVNMLRQAGMGTEEGRLSIGIKRLLSVIEMARQEPEAVAERLTSALMGLGM
ncbi:AAA-domain-containing protein [Russula dissimulans]|nr:AAA-domain-containing protein [Russula dissimulans]